ncbi:MULTISPECIES: hypothetical protein [unclassified Bacteroides]|uniref:hypothetical protein n=2 Tax=Bacteroides TaxID=816 RepID=UPI001C377524|nr:MULTISPECIES: hypothetical protein [unclassified Bacteroides]MBV3670099.1 hypothetical protein [Bacteroides sp. MSK.18.83]MBV3713378.1 hypothetical protein [Bacteroides sp. MSK.18.39]MBV3741059.1 hypothetical protein [Bacteroides sp. MSK.18.37]MBV3757201.1 hypothetical protein [Bacteroides sp. MSK.18.22]
MGLVSWIKDKYYNHKFQKAKEILREGKSEQAIEIFKEILNYHPDAPSELLSIYHSIIYQGDSKRVSDVASLYENHHSLKKECVDFARSLEVNNNVRLRINYYQALYSKGICELLNPFVTSTVKFVLENDYIDNLQTFTNDSSLLYSLSESILIEAQKYYAQKANLEKSKKLCLLIRPYLTSKDFYELYSNVRFDIIAQDNITKESVKQLDVLFKDIKTVYRLSDATLNTFTNKRLELANTLLEQKDYIAALLISQLLIEKSVKARKIYADSALKLYTSANSKADSIESETLYKCLGNDNSVLVSTLEPFIPYSTHKKKYISVVISELSRLITTNQQTQAEVLFNKAWGFTSDNNLIKTVLSNGSNDSKTHFATLIITSDKTFLSNNSSLMCYVEELSKLENVEFIVSTLEILLGKGKNVKSNYETQILRLAKVAKNKSRKRVEIIERGLTKIKANSLYGAEADYLNDYIDSGCYDSKFARNISSSLIAHSDLAEILIAKISIDEAVKSPDSEYREKKLREALTIKNTHDKLFNKAVYETLLPEIQKRIIELAKEIYVTDQIRAIELLYLLRDNSLSWFDTYASLYLELIQNKDGSEEIASKILSIIAEGADGDSATYDNLWSKYVSIKCLIISSTDNDDAISNLTNLHSELESLCSSNNKKDLQKEILSILSKRLLIRAKECEKNKVYDKAIEDYNRIISLSGKYSDIMARIFICKLKDRQLLLDADKDEIDNLLSTNKNKKYQQDLAYRWCIYLISQGLMEKAEEINVRILKTDNEIAQICQEERINTQQRILDELNQRICKLNQSELTPEEAIAFGQSLSKTLSDISLIVQVSTQKSNILKESIRLYAIEKFYQQGNYLQCINGLKVHDSTYLSDPIALRNIAIMSLNAAENGLLTKSNYKELLAIWATTIYQQKIFVESLNYTSWDDPYTFTLESALGQLDYNKEGLPDNVNYETPSDNNVISILEVQKTLLSRMETAIQDNLEYQHFFSSQLEAMDKLAGQELDEPCELVAPYMLEISNTYKNDVSKALEIEAEGHYGNWEMILEIGCLYGLNNGDFNNYASALDSLNTAITSIERKQEIERSFSQMRISQIKEFDGLKNNLISSVTTAINNDISQNIEYFKFYSEYGIVVKNIDDDTLAFIFSNYINQQVVKALNNKTQTLAKGAPILFEIYNFCKCNPHLKRNLENIVEALIHNYISDGDEENLTVLDNTLAATREFDPVVVKSLKGNGEVPEEMLVLLFSSNENRFNMLKTKIGRKSSTIQNQFTATTAKISIIKVQIELSQIVDQVNNNTINKCDALQKVYNIYKNNKSNVPVCKNLATLIPMCIMEYVIPDKYGKTKVEAVLDSLKLNMSPTFKTQNSEIGEAYTMIWNQLPYNARSAIQNNPWSLNEQGQALKKGLDYLKDLR